MNRRELLCSIVGVTLCSLEATADCRDDKGMIGPGESKELLEITLRRAIVTSDREKVTARALFGFGAYEDLLKHSKEKTRHSFLLDGRKAAIQVTRLDVDVNRRIGCVVCEVHGRLYA